MIGLLPFLFALVIASSAAETAAPPTLAFASLSAFIGTSLAAWIGVCVAASRWVGRSREHRLLTHWDTIAQAVALAWFALLCYRWGWASAAPGMTVAMLPFAAMLVVHWWAMTDAVSGVTGYRWQRRAMVVHHLRLSALPLILVLVLLSDGGDWIMRRIPEDLLGDKARVLVISAGMELLMVGTVLFLPPVLVAIWGAVPMPPGPMRDDLSRICGEMGVRVRQLMSWPVYGGKMYNAAVVGAVGRLRYVLFTEDLARDLPRDQVRAVLGHELGHVRHGHLWLYLVFANVAMAAQALVGDDVRQSLDQLPWFIDLPLEVRSGVARILVLAGLFRIAFGWISRACERQADLAGAELVGDPAIMQEALKSVARLSGQPDTAPNWRHHSIAERVAFLDRARTDPPTIAEHHRRVASMRLSLVFLLAVLVALLAFSLVFNPLGLATTDPARAMAQLQDEDPDLRTALERADEGQVTLLVTWLQRQEDTDRLRFAAAQLELLVPADPAHPDDAALYRLRHRLRALVNVDLGQPELELAAANALAYGLVAGTPTPGKAEIDQARQLLPLLEKTMEAQPDDAVLDTIGCVRYRLGDFQQARDRFAKAVELAATRPADPPRTWRYRADPTRAAGADALRRQRIQAWQDMNAESLRLYHARLAASERSLAAAGNGQPTEPLPLALDAGAVPPVPAEAEKPAANGTIP